MNVCFISASWVREREILASLNKKVNLLFVMPYKKNINYSIQDITDFCKKNKIKYIINNTSKNTTFSLGRVKNDFSVIRKIKNFNAEIIYIAAFGSPYFAILSRLFLGNKKTIIAIMDYKLHQRSAGSFKFSEKFYLFIQVRFFTYFQFFSYTQNKIFQNDYPKKKSFAIRLFLVDKDLHQQIQIEDKKNVNFLFFGRIFYYKGIDVLIKATNILAEKYSNFCVTIAGDTNNWNQEYQPLIEAQNVFDLKIRFIDKEELPNLFSNADYFVAPYREVTQSGPLLRAYNYNIIPIVSDREGFTEYVKDNITGFVFENENLESLAKKMEKAINLPLIKKKTIITNIKTFKSKEFNIQTVTEKYIEMFNNIAK